MDLLKKTLIWTTGVILFKKKKLLYNNWYETIQIILFANGIELSVQWTPYQNSETVFKYN